MHLEEHNLATRFCVFIATALNLLVWCLVENSCKRILFWECRLEFARANYFTKNSLHTFFLRKVKLDIFYAKSIPGILKIAEAIVSLIGFICVQMVSNQYYAGSASGWFIFVAMTAFWVTLVVVVLYLFHIIEKLHWIPWLLGELGFAALWAVFYFIAACVVVARSGEDAAWGAAAFFGRANNQHYNVHDSKLSDILKKSFSGSNQLLGYNH
ncbi:hypothetical protein CDAR_243521 [Caerostris darwini]|uniref:MARVEL domain-containing protein n=1 Tax=Caerostris darwini TaxID=1538125 RepID=A0AAV4VDJ6_9ARAC|nr:hypothetical protein CDAR_243521 [Caerostris darwini]